MFTHIDLEHQVLGLQNPAGKGQATLGQERPEDLRKFPMVHYIRRKHDAQILTVSPAITSSFPLIVQRMLR